MLRSLVIASLTVTLWTCGSNNPAIDAGTGTGGGTTGGGAAATGGGGSTATGGGSTATGGGSTATGGGSTATGGGGSTATGGGSTATGGGGGGSSATGGGSSATGGGSTATGGGGSSATGGGSATSVRFIAIGDQGKGNAGQNAVGAAMGTFCAANGCDFVVLLGDNFYPSGVSGTTDGQWQTAFVQPYATVNAPFYAVLGNHDYGGEGLGSDIPKGRNEVDYSAVNPKWRMPDTHYKWSLGNVDFFAADTNRSMFNIDQDVQSDFATWFAASTAQWKIVFGHHPLKSNGEHGNAGNYDGLSFIPIVNGSKVKEFVEESVCGKADFYITGHDHHLEWIQATCGRAGSNLLTQLVVSGGGASATTTPGNQPTHYKSAQLGFAYVVITGNTLTLTFFDQTGTQLFTRTVTK